MLMISKFFNWLLYTVYVVYSIYGQTSVDPSKLGKLTMESLRSAAAAVKVFVASNGDVYHCHFAHAKSTSHVYRKMDAECECSCSSINVTVEEITATSSSVVAVQESDPSVSRGEKPCEMAGLHKFNNVIISSVCRQEAYNKANNIAN